MDEFSTSELETIFKRVPLLAGYSPEDFQIKPLNGYTNFNFHLKNDRHDWVLRIPKPQTNPYINRLHEAHNADSAFRLGIAPENVWRDESGLSLTMTLSKSHPLNEPDLETQAVFKAMIATLSRLHKSKILFRGTIDLAALIIRYFQMVPVQHQKRIQPGYDKALGKIENLTKQKMPLVPSHNDPVLENLLIDAAGKVWLIDWEYSSMASPYWDLAILCNAANFEPSQSKRLLREYQNDNDNLKIEILDEYRFVLQVLSTCWMAAFADVETEPGLGKPDQ